MINEHGSSRVFDGLAAQFDALGAGHQLVVAVDDIHWVDDTSRQFLHYLARHVGTRPLLLILTYRGEEMDGDESLSGFVPSLRREAHAWHFPLARLSRMLGTTTQALVEHVEPWLFARELVQTTPGGRVAVRPVQRSVERDHQADWGAPNVRRWRSVARSTA